MWPVSLFLSKGRLILLSPFIFLMIGIPCFLDWRPSGHGFWSGCHSDFFWIVLGDTKSSVNMSTCFGLRVLPDRKELLASWNFSDIFTWKEVLWWCARLQLCQGFFFVIWAPVSLFTSYPFHPKMQFSLQLGELWTRDLRQGSYVPWVFLGFAQWYQFILSLSISPGCHVQ